LVLILVHVLCFLAYWSAIAHILYPRSVALFCERAAERTLVTRLLYRCFWVGPRITTAYGSTLRANAGVSEPFWRDVVMMAAISLYLVTAVKLFG